MAATAALSAMLDECPGRIVTVRTIKDRREKYGRYLARLIGPDGVSMNDKLVLLGHATTT